MGYRGLGKTRIPICFQFPVRSIFVVDDHVLLLAATLKQQTFKMVQFKEYRRSYGEKYLKDLIISNHKEHCIPIHSKLQRR
ncbi:hypothetical protein NPIL_89821 [Nephila pilipes]|uniref:Uncharacterized protein n=1 Tax=Nephila pilipes TaxID=299642 RepID=A0A8X6N1K2_NEPPI|nr:hypothetical protein NPIL_89821 [Nephila pilipes]